MRNRYNWLLTTEVMMERFETELANPNSTLPYDETHWTRILHDPEYRARLEREAAMERAKAVRDTVLVIGRAVGAVFRGLFRAFAMIAEGSAAVRLYEELSRLDDGALADLGITREQIPQYVVDSMGSATGRRKADLSAIEGGLAGRPVAAEALPSRRAA